MLNDSSEKKRVHWKERVLKQRSSGLSIVAWCHQHHVNIHTFHYWKDKLFPKIPLDRSAFTEISDGKNTSAFERKGAIMIEYKDVRIHLDQFTPSALKQCLEILKGVLC